jgi:hypothetical protein
MAKDQTERGKKEKNAIFHIISQKEATRGKVEGNERIFSTTENDEKSSVIHSRIFFRHFQFIRWKDGESMRGFTCTYFNEFFTSCFYFYFYKIGTA